MCCVWGSAFRLSLPPKRQNMPSHRNRESLTQASCVSGLLSLTRGRVMLWAAEVTQAPAPADFPEDPILGALEVALSSRAGRASTNQASLLAPTPAHLPGPTHSCSPHWLIASLPIASFPLCSLAPPPNKPHPPHAAAHFHSHSMLLCFCSSPFSPCPILASPSPSLHT